MANLVEGVAIHETHANGVAVAIDGRWRRETSIVERLQERKFFHGRQPRHVKPTDRLAVLQVISFLKKG